MWRHYLELKIYNILSEIIDNIGLIELTYVLQQLCKYVGK